ncbi:unnamed protein product [Lactuca saligna]|uniref:Polymerase nucleotidyl transferase domain-containing protein n=1 Tax=Lactuca saligna TaxID=75948 RepID=A0AA36EBS7_LACSI|nr:unnamed protein product [Lactuca saligna]
MGDLAMEEDRPFSPSFAAPLSNPDPNTIRAETWVLAEDPVREVLNCIHPTLDSDEKRKDVIEYVQKLIRCNLRLEVFPYGSVPLKTYLPDGDIDLTVLSTPNLDENLPREVLRVLQEEEQNGNTEFILKDTQFIDAEVKLVKCLVQDIVIDISFNQLGGLCTLCFLEQVDRLVGKDHLFKRSIILIKAWCYYESRILGAHHGLISTYALETLVLYIFHVFNASLNSPTEVLYRFLDYYSKFDWDEYCISLDGPVSKSSMPDFSAETQENQGTDVLLTGEFRKNCMDMFIVPSKGIETDQRGFTLKHLNIIDPLKENNNLGRSVHRGNYYRIRSAFRFGAKKLGRILESNSNMNIGDEIKKFFTNTLQRHKPKYGPAFTYGGVKGLGNLSISSLSEAAYYEDDMYSRFSNGDFDDKDSPIPNLAENKVSDLELWMERSESQIVDGDTLCLCFDKNGSVENGSDNLSIGETELLNPFSDLTGDYDAHIRNLLYGQGCHGYALSTAMVRATPTLTPSPPTSPYEKKNHPWDPPRSIIPFQPNTNAVVMGHPTPAYLSYPPNAALRGTGLYIPVVNSSNSSCKEKRSPTRGGRGGGGRSRGPPPSNGHVPRASGRGGETKLVVEPNNNNQIRSPRQGRVDQVNGFVNQPRKLEFGSFRSLPETPQTPKKLDANATKQGRIGENSFHLKNEDEFPPLSS